MTTLDVRPEVTATLNAIAHLPHVTVIDGDYIGERFVGHALPHLEAPNSTSNREFALVVAHPDHLPQMWQGYGGGGSFPITDVLVGTWEIPDIYLGCQGRWVRRRDTRPATREEILRTLPRVRIVRADSTIYHGQEFPYLPRGVVLGEGARRLEERYCGMVFREDDEHVMWHAANTHVAERRLPEWVAGGRVYWVDEVEPVEPEVLDTSEDDGPEPSTEDEDEVISLRRQLTELQEQHTRDLATISEILGDEAENREWCSEYEQVVERINRNITGELTPCRGNVGTVRVTVTGYARVPWTMTLDLADMELDGEGDPDDDVINERVQSWLNDEYVEHNPTTVVDHDTVTWEATYTIDGDGIEEAEIEGADVI